MKILAEVGQLTPAERAMHIEKTCGGDAELKAVVNFLLDEEQAEVSSNDPSLARQQSEIDLLDAESFASEELRAEPRTTFVSFGAPKQIGRYKILQPIGEGGFGSVFMAEQEHPIRRAVAIKIIKAGMDTKNVIARFEAERQALAMMDHPNIAKVLDAGETERGRPFFVMELVRGIPITEYCDQNNLAIRERLELFVPVCQAVQHAHQKGIIHRDIKPSNVLVTLLDGRPVPKVIDFGIAKATLTRLTEKTMFTQLRQFMGTPEYMSPEQAEMTGLDIDTRVDIYSLGVLLYELLTGTTPFDATELSLKDYAEIQRTIREVETPRPSTRLSAMGVKLVGIASHRQCDPTKLRRVVRGELEWIVMKCLEKDRTRRYDTATTLALDVRNYLDNEPVLARPVSSVYRLRKLVSRHKVATVGVGAVFMAVLLGLVLAMYGMIQARLGRIQTEGALETKKGLLQSTKSALVRAESSENNAIQAQRQAEAINAFLERMLTASRGKNGSDASMSVRTVLENAAKALDDGELASSELTEAAVRDTLGRNYLELGLIEPAARQMEEAYRIRSLSPQTDPADISASMESMALLSIERNDHPNALGYLVKAIANRRDADDEESLMRLLKMFVSEQTQLGNSESATKAAKEFDQINQRQKAIWTTQAQAKEKEVRRLEGLHDFAGAERVLRELLGIYAQNLGKEAPKTAGVHYRLGRTLLDLRNPADAEKSFREAVTTYSKLRGDDHPSTAVALKSLGISLALQGHQGEANAVVLRMLRGELAGIERGLILRRDDVDLLTRQARLLGRLKRFSEAMAVLDRALLLDPDASANWLPAAILHLHAGEVDKYRDVCQRMKDKFSNTTHAEMAESLAKACLLADGPQLDLTLCSTLIDRALQSRDQHHRDSFLVTLAMLEYRRQHFGESAKILRQVLFQGGDIAPAGRANAFLYLAMVLMHDSTVAFRATERLNDGEQSIVEQLSRPYFSGDIGNTYDAWALAEITLKEARSLIRPGAKSLSTLPKKPG